MVDAPPKYVLDASAVSKMFLDEPESRALRAWHVNAAVGGALFHAPDLLPYELAQVITRRTTLAAHEPAFRQVLADALTGILLQPAAAEVVPLLGALSVFDASYVAVALGERARLVTYDTAMAKTARLHGVAVLTPAADSP